MNENTAQTEAILTIIRELDKGAIALPEFQRDFRWELEKTYDLFDSLARDIFIGTIIYGKPSFPISCRELDMRPRRRSGSRTKLKVESFSEQDVKRKVQVENFRLVLDGQQRLTSIYRAVRGIDQVYLVLSEHPSGETLEALMDPIDSFRGEEREDRICISVHDAYKMDAEQWRESRILSRFRETKLFQTRLYNGDPHTADRYFEIYLQAVKLIQELLKREKLVAYYLLDMNLGKFCTFFERSNSLGIQLNFTDILAAKLYAGFNLRASIERFEESHPEVVLNRELLIRAVSYLTSSGVSVDKDYILRSLTPEDFTKYWNSVCDLYLEALRFLYDNSFILSQEWMPSENMLLPLMLFFRESGGSSSMSQEQYRFLEFWFWSSTFAAARYTGGASNEVIIEDSRVLRKIARNEPVLDSTYLRRLRSRIADPDDILSFRKKGNSIYKGLLNLVNYASQGIRDWSNGSRLTFNQALDDHHIFPKAFMKVAAEYRDNYQVQELVDCVANRTLIPKNTNLQIGSKPPSKYLAHLGEKNPQLFDALKTHLIDDIVLDPESDDMFEDFLQSRAGNIFEVVDRLTRKAASTFGALFPSTPPPRPEERFEVFFEYKGQRFDAIYLPSSQRIEFRGELLAPTSAAWAAVLEAGGTGRPGSGWQLWKYCDSAGQERQIDELRQE